MSPGSSGVMEEKYSMSVGNLEDQFAGVGVLQDFAVDGEADGELMRVGDFVGGDDGGADGAEGGEALAHGPLRGGELHVAGADVVDDGVAVDVVAPSGGGDAIAAVADDEGEFGFVVGLGGVFGQDDGFAGADDGGGQLEEDDGVWGCPCRIRWRGRGS